MLATASQSDTVKPRNPQSRRTRTFNRSPLAQAGVPWIELYAHISERALPSITAMRKAGR